jgi:hypothetical protein
MYDIGRGLGDALIFMFWVAGLSVPLAIWKLIDIAVWLYRHVTISFG